MKETRMPPAYAANLAANSEVTLYGVDKIGHSIMPTAGIELGVPEYGQSVQIWTRPMSPGKILWSWIHREEHE